MKILKTGHIIADTVAAALEEGLYGAFNGSSMDIPIGYGILRGTAEQFKKAKNYLHIDRGYFKPGHYAGYYRVSLNGTQQTTGLDQFEDDARFRQLGIEVKPWRGFDRSKPVLVIPPTEYVEDFFGKWFLQPGTLRGDTKYVSRDKSCKEPINFDDYSHVITFNSSVGWQALQNGIPCVSDPTHSIVGARYHNISLDNLEEAQYIDRHKLFAVMANLQLSLEEIRAGTKLWELLSKLLNLTSLSDSTAGSPSPLTWPRTAF